MGRIRKAQETRDKILDAAEDVFNDKGVSHTTLNDIAEAAGVTRGAIYWHFKNKFDVFEAMCNRVYEPMTAMVDAIAEGKTEDPLGDLYKSGLFVMAQVIENEHYRKVLNILFHKCEYINDSSEILGRQKTWRVSRVTVLEKILEKARQMGQVPADLNIKLASSMMHAVFSGMMSTWLFMPESFNLEEDAAKINRIMLDILGTHPLLRS